MQQLSERESLEQSLRSDLDELKRKLVNVNQDLDDAKQRVASTESQLGEQNRQLDTALSDRLELEAKVEAASDERRSLLERCLAAENEVDRARSAASNTLLKRMTKPFKSGLTFRRYTFIAKSSRFLLRNKVFCVP